jgi:hypothetical protein
VSGRREPHDHDAGVGVAESRHRTAPVVLIREAPDLLPCDELPPPDEAGASSTRDDTVANGAK